MDTDIIWQAFWQIINTPVSRSWLAVAVYCAFIVVVTWAALGIQRRDR